MPMWIALALGAGWATGIWHAVLIQSHGGVWRWVRKTARRT